MLAETKNTLRSLKAELDRLKGYLDLEKKRNRLNELEYVIAKPDFWDDPESTKSILRERSQLSQQIDHFNSLENSLEDCGILLELSEEADDSDVLKEVHQQAEDIGRKIRQLELDIMLDDPDDERNAIVSINAGAGGTEAQDWSEMLFRMYSRWVERKGFEMELIDLQPGDEAGVKSVTFTVSGRNAYGYLKSEKGVHRLVRISPFNANAKRHTSFSSVFVYPELDNEIVVDVDEKDLRIDVFRASGAGGQHVNKTSSAVRVTHLPTGITVQCQQEKSQHRNKDLAMKVLRARLYQLEKQKQDEKIQEMHDAKEEIAWGSQIRSYVLHPYQLVKDHRISMDIGNVNSVLDGDIDPFIEAVLMSGKAG
ncbi:MAG: peptide chain release factor 2 [Desulfobacterales bacterium]